MAGRVESRELRHRFQKMDQERKSVAVGLAERNRKRIGNEKSFAQEKAFAGTARNEREKRRMRRIVETSRVSGYRMGESNFSLKVSNSRLRTR